MDIALPKWSSAIYLISVDDGNPTTAKTAQLGMKNHIMAHYFRDEGGGAHTKVHRMRFKLR